MLDHLPAAGRGAFTLDWLDSRHSFSFGEYWNPKRMGFRALRVINEDKVAPDSGFPTHGHADMEIVTYMISGSLAHRDSTGGAETIKAGEVQRMSAGTGIHHSEMNPSKNEEAHLLQIWIKPARIGVKPGYEQKKFSDSDKRDRLLPIVAPDGADGALSINQDARVYASVLGKGKSVKHALAPGRGAWVQVVEGAVAVDGRVLAAGDGAGLDAPKEAARTIDISSPDGGEFLLFDLA